MKGDVVVPFPFTGLSSWKKRPAVIAAKLGGDDVVLCQITSKERNGSYSIALTGSDFRQGELNLASIIRPNRIFTAAKSLIFYKAGNLTDRKTREIEEKIVSMFRS